MSADRYRQVMGRLKLRHLRLIDAIAAARSLSEAALRLNITQPAASKGLREIEDILGIPLFSRGPKGLTLTAFGRSLLAHSRTIQSEVRHIAEEIEAIKEGSFGAVQVGSMLVGLPILLPTALQLLRERHSDVPVRVTEGTQGVLIEELRSGTLDLVVGRLTPINTHERFDQEVLFQEPIVVVAGLRHSLLRRNTVSYRDLAEARWILPPPDSVVHGPVLQMFAQHGLSNPRPYAETTSYLLIRSLLIDQDAVAALPLSVVRHDIERGDIAIVPVQLPHEPLSVGIVTVRDRVLLPAASQLLFCIREAGKQMSHGGPLAPPPQIARAARMPTT
jgi:DNA-binding transcriptional LysR family regulator